jgi:hypothetical protein
MSVVTPLTATEAVPELWDIVYRSGVISDPIL